MHWGQEAVPSAFLDAPQCTACPDNPYNGAGQSFWTERPYATYTPDPGVAVNIALTASTVLLSNGTSYGPLAGYYLFNVQTLRPK
jgi:hypothetical protein